MNSVSFSEICEAFQCVGDAVRDATGMPFDFARPDSHGHQNSHTFYMAYTGPMRRVREFKVDMTISEAVVHELEHRPILATYGSFDFPDGRTIKSYSLAEIASEKIVALTDPARNQPRDLFDIWKLQQEFGLEMPELAFAIAQKLTFRGRDADKMDAAFGRKEGNLRATWSARLDPQMGTTPPFETVYRDVKRIFRQSELFELVLDQQRRNGPDYTRDH